MNLPVNLNRLLQILILQDIKNDSCTEDINLAIITLITKYFRGDIPWRAATHAKWSLIS
jgi:hypothetical protein